jgi:hypothetical protein
MSAGENPPAFPLPSVAISDHGIAHANPGMSLRDWFASTASEADIDAHMQWDGLTFERVSTREAARYAYADAMLLARTGSAEQ